MYNSRYDSNNKNYFSLGDYSETDFKDIICNTPKCTLVVFDMFRVYYKLNINFTENKIRDSELIMKPRVNM